jgi:hypothetical protein
MYPPPKPQSLSASWAQLPMARYVQLEQSPAPSTPDAVPFWIQVNTAPQGASFTGSQRRQRPVLANRLDLGTLLPVVEVVLTPNTDKDGKPVHLSLAGSTFAILLLEPNGYSVVERVVLNVTDVSVVRPIAVVFDGKPLKWWTWHSHQPQTLIRCDFNERTGQYGPNTSNEVSDWHMTLPPMPSPVPVLNHTLFLVFRIPATQSVTPRVVASYGDEGADASSTTVLDIHVTAEHRMVHRFTAPSAVPTDSSSPPFGAPLAPDTPQVLALTLRQVSQSTLQCAVLHPSGDVFRLNRRLQSSLPRLFVGKLEVQGIQPLELRLLPAMVSRAPLTYGQMRTVQQRLQRSWGIPVSTA